MIVDLARYPGESMRPCLASISMRHLLAVGVVALGLAACASPGDLKADREEKQQDIADDVELLGCKPSANGWMAAQVRVVNHSSERSNYLVEVAFTSPDEATQYDTGTASVSALAPEQTADDVVTTYGEAPGPYACEVVDVTRYSDE